jgi:hypothetical protein
MRIYLVRIPRRKDHSNQRDVLPGLSQLANDDFNELTAVLFSVTSTCQRLGVEPWAYQQEILTCLPTTASTRLYDLLPDRWQTAREASRAEVDLRCVASVGSAESLP